MARIAPLSFESASAEAQAVLKEIESAFGIVPNVFKTMAHYPPLLALNWSRVKTLMMSGNLSRKVKETISVLVSKDNSCNYCVTAHTMFLQQIGVPEDELFAIKGGKEAMLKRLTSATRKRRLSLSCAKRMSRHWRLPIMNSMAYARLVQQTRRS